MKLTRRKFLLITSTFATSAALPGVVFAEEETPGLIPQKILNAGQGFQDLDLDPKVQEQMVRNIVGMLRQPEMGYDHAPLKDAFRRHTGQEYTPEAAARYAPACIYRPAEGIPTS